MNAISGYCNCEHKQIAINLIMFVRHLGVAVKRSELCELLDGLYSLYSYFQSEEILKLAQEFEFVLANKRKSVFYFSHRRVLNLLTDLKERSCKVCSG